MFIVYLNSVGNALSNKIKKIKKNIRRIIDGELNEGSNWETLLFASHHKLDNLVIIIDYNKIQISRFCKKQVNFITILKIKFLSFLVFKKKKIIDGHNHSMIRQIFQIKTRRLSNN